MGDPRSHAGAVCAEPRSSRPRARSTSHVGLARLDAFVLLALVALVGGCGGGGSDAAPSPTPTTAPPRPPPPPAPTLAQVLGAASVSRDPTEAPSAQEETALQQNDAYLFAAVSRSGSVSTYDTRLNALIGRVGITTTFAAYVATDFRVAGLAYGGGVSGHRVLLLDGKLLDILHEYAVYLALSRSGSSPSRRRSRSTGSCRCTTRSSAPRRTA